MSIRVPERTRVSETATMILEIRALGREPPLTKNPTKNRAWCAGFLAGYHENPRQSPYAQIVHNRMLHQTWSHAYDEGKTLRRIKDDI